MFTTPTKTPRFRLRPYDSPLRPSPGGPFFPLSPPLTASPFNTPSPRRLNLANPFTPSPKGHRIGSRTPTPLRRQRLSPGRRPVLPLHLIPEPGLGTIMEETSAAVQNTRLPLNNDEKIYWNELERLGALHSFNNALADARENVHRGVKDGPLINTEIDAQSQVHFPTKAELEDKRKAREAKAEVEAEQKAQIKRERARRKSLERRAQRQREEEKKNYQEKLAEKKRQRMEREQRAKEAQATPWRSRDPPSPAAEPAFPHNPQPMQADQNPDAPAARWMQEKLEAARLAEHQAVEEARVRLVAQQEEAKRLEEERFRVEMERSQAAKARKRAEEERMRAEMEFARAEEEIRKAEELRQWAQRQHEERLRAIQEEARLASQRKAEEQAQRATSRRKHEARIQADREAFAQRQAEMRRIAEQAEDTFSARMTRLADLQRLEEAMEARFRAELENIASYASPLAEFYIRQAAQRAAEREQAQQRYEQSPPHDNYSGTYQRQSGSSDIPMGEPSMDASMHSVCDDTPYADEPPLTQPKAPPQPPTIAERFALWEAKWKAIDSTDNLFTVAFHQLPWPILHDITGVHDIDPQHITEFLSHSDRPPHLSAKKVISYYHSDKFKFRVMHKMHPDQQMLAAEIANHCTILLVNHMR